MTDTPPSRPPETLEETMARLQAHRPAPQPEGQPRPETAPPVGPSALGYSAPAGAPPSGVAPPGAPPANTPPWAGAVPQPGYSTPTAGLGAAPGGATPPGYGSAYVPPSGVPEGPKRGKKAPWIIAGVGVVAAVVVGAIMVTLMTNNSIIPAEGVYGGVDWSGYPGTSYSDPAEVLADTSLEELVEKATALETAYRDRLTEELGLVWTMSYEGGASISPNGYGEDSMLYDYNSGEWQGSAIINDPGARERVYEIFMEVVEAAEMNDSYLANEVYDNDDKVSKQQFGAPFGSEQALWGMVSQGLSRTFTFSTKVFDQSYPVDKTFTGDVWFRLDDASDGNFHVTFTTWAYLLLPAEDRAEYIERLKPYEGLEIPEPR